MKATFEQVQQAFIEGKITLQQLVSILIDNFGSERTVEILTDIMKKDTGDYNEFQY